MRGSIVALMLLVACAREGAPMQGEGSTGDSTSSSTTGDASSSSSTGEGSSSSSSSSSSGELSSSSTTGESCSPFDECREASDCPLPDAECRSCVCVGGTGCALWGEGAWGACLIDGMANTDLCMSNDALCLPDQQSRPAGATCVFPGCDEPCDCPQPPPGFEAQVACDDVANNGGATLECYLSCERGLACPEGWSCAQDLYCVLPGLMTLEPWAACDVSSLCPATDSGNPGVCFDLAFGSVCSTEGCADAADCGDMPATGKSPVTCADVNGDAEPECILDCSNGRACPDGMTCKLDNFCVNP